MLIQIDNVLQKNVLQKIEVNLTLLRLTNFNFSYIEATVCQNVKAEDLNNSWQSMSVGKTSYFLVALPGGAMDKSVGPASGRFDVRVPVFAVAWKRHAHAYSVISRITKNKVILERIVKLLELVSNRFVFVYTIKYVQFK